MKIKLISMAALAVCGSSAFAAPLTCTNSGTSTVELVTTCAPEVTLYMAGASAQQPAMVTLMTTTDSVFDLSKAIAKVSRWSSGDLGARNTDIYVGTGSTKLGQAAAGKRIAVVFNTANGSFAGVKQMTEGKDTNGISGSVGGELASQGLVTTAMVKAGTALNCTRSGTDWVAPAAGLAPTIPSYACAGNAFNYVTTAPAGGVKGVQLALADVAPNQAVPGVLTAGKWTTAKFPLTVTGMQGFGVMVNDKALQALIRREADAGRMPASCKTIGATDGTTSPLTAACQPNLSHADMAALISGRATAALISGDAADATVITYNRRVDFSGTQASSNIQFGGQAATEGFKAADVLSGKVKPTGYLTLSDVGTTPVGGNFTKTSADGKFVSKAYVSSSSMAGAVSGDTTTYAFAVLSLEKNWNATKADSGISGASWVKIGGISPNFGGATMANDPKNRVGMVNGYPFQYEMVAIKNAANSKTPAIAAVVDGIVAGLQDPAYNLTGIAYLGTPAGSASAAEIAKFAKYTRGGLGNNYAPLSVK